jgi:hypothetical protein
MHLPGSASYQRGYVDGICRALAILAASPQDARRVLEVVRDNVDTEYHEGIDPAGGFGRALASLVAHDLGLPAGELPPGFGDLKPAPVPPVAPSRFERFVATFPLGHDVPEWKRTSFYDTETGAVYPAFVTGLADDAVLALLGHDSAGFVHDAGHLYAAASWIAANYPDTKTACDNAAKATRDAAGHPPKKE